MPQQPSFNSPEEARLFYKSPEWLALMKLHKNYSIEMKPAARSISIGGVALKPNSQT
jgi:hypothetical protein